MSQHDDDDDNNIMDDLALIFGVCLALFGIALVGSLVFALVLEVLA